jgi:hypothetical protein
MRPGEAPWPGKEDLLEAELNPYAPPKTDVAAPGKRQGGVSGCWQDGKLLVMTKDFVLPDRCVKCNLPAEGYRLRRNLSWHHPAFYLFILIHILLYVIVALAVRKTARIEVGLCPAHRSERRLAITVAWLLVLAGVAISIVGVMYFNSEAAPLAAICGAILLISGAVCGVWGSQPVVAKKIDDRFVWLAKVTPEFLAEYPVWLS